MRPRLSVGGVLTDHLVWGVVAFGLLGMVLYAQALGSGDVGSVTAALWVTEVVVPAIAGVGERLARRLLRGESVRERQLRTRSPHLTTRLDARHRRPPDSCGLRTDLSVEVRSRITGAGPRRLSFSKAH